jgi:HK97 family phage portal protein
MKRSELGQGKPRGFGNKVRASVLQFLGIPISLTNNEFWAAWGSVPNSSGQTVTVSTALSLSAFVACVRLIAESISTLPLVLYRNTSNGRKRAENHPLYPVLLNMPNQDMTATLMWEAYVASMLMWGCGRAEKLSFNGRTVGLNFLDPCRLNITCLNDGTKKYTYRDLNGKFRVIPPANIFGVPGFTLDGINGVSAIQFGGNVLGTALAADQAAASTFKNGLLPTTYFSMERVLQKKQRDEFREEVMPKITGAMNAGKPPLLEAGMKVGTVGINPTDAQLLESRGWSVEEICRLMRVPPWLIGYSPEGQTKWGTGMEQELLAFLTFSLRPWLTRIAQGVSKDLLTPSERVSYYAAYDLTDFLKADSAARSAFYNTMVNSGIFTRDECRQKEDMPLVGGNASKLTVQSAMTLLDNLGQQPTPGEQLDALARHYFGVPDNET